MNDAVTAQLREAVRTIQALRARVATLQTERSPPVAVVGMACRFAGANDPAGLWKVLAGGVDTVRPTPPDRWDNAIWHSPDPDAPGRVAFREAAFLDDVDSFDNALFGIAAREAAGMDPQHRLLLELAWSALEHAAIRPDGLAGTATGVFLGLNGGDHMMAALAAPERVGSHALAGAVGSIAAGRIAYAFGLTGPAMVVDTACSSSLVAVHLAVQSLRRGECAMALAGGAHLMLAPNVSVALSRARMMAPDGRCKAFDAAADGFGQGEGGGMVVLKRLADAEAAGDRVLAVIAGSALNQDGRSAGITAPNQRAQEAVIRAALEDAGCTPEQVDAVEAHGTGTGLGDPLELHALAAVFAGRTRALPVGSVKTNVGHTAAAAGVAGLIKAVLMLQRQAVPPVVHFRRLNPHISLDGVPIEIPAALRPMALGCVGVSSFGFSGTNAHVVLTRPPDRVAAVAAEHAPGLLLSARSAEALRSLIDRTRAAVAGGLAFADACHTAWRGRARFEWWVHAGSPAALDEAAFGRVEPRRGPIPELLAQAPQAGQAGRIGDMPGVAFDRQHFPRIAGARSTPDALYPGQRIDTPSDDRMLECVLDLQAQPWLGDHRVQDRVVVPGAVMVALLLSVAATDGLADIRFVEPVIMEHAPVRLVAIARPDGSLAVGSRGADGWIWHATARAIAPQVTAVHPSTLQAPAPQRPVLQAPLSPVAAPAPWTDAASPLGAAGSAAPAMGREQWTGHLAAMGITIGSVFQGIASITPGPVTTAVIDASRLGDPVGGAFHPALLDAVLQVAGGVLPAEPVLPVGIGSLTLHAPLAAPLHITARLRGEAVDLLAHSGPRLVASVEGLTVRRLGDTLPPVVAAVTWRAAAAVAGVERPAVFQVAPGGENLGEALVLVRRLLAEPRSVVFLTGGAVPPVSDPGAAAFAGLASALAAERPELRCRCVDIAPGTPDLLVERELASADAEPLVALRPDGRFVPRLLRLAGAAGSLRLSGTVLITGGMGGIGRHAAAWAGARGAEALLLVGRHAAARPHTAGPHATATRPDATDLQAADPHATDLHAGIGVKTRVLALDIAAPDAADRLRAALADMPRLRTVIHAAGVLRDGLIDDLGPADFAASLAPKLGGARTLHALTERMALDHFLLFGSVASLIGAAGQANYAAANAALDAFAHWRRAQGLPATTIAWGRWGGVGMAAGLSPALTARVTARGVPGMSAARAIAALDQAVLSGEPVVMVAGLDLARLAESAPPVFADLMPAPVPQTAPVAAQVAALVGQILGQPAAPGQPLVACGLDSLMAMDLRNRLNRRFTVSLGLADLMGGTDVAGLAAAVERAIAADVAMEEETL